MSHMWLLSWNSQRWRNKGKCNPKRGLRPSTLERPLSQADSTSRPPPGQEESTKIITLTPHGHGKQGRCPTMPPPECPQAACTRFPATWGPVFKPGRLAGLLRALSTLTPPRFAPAATTRRSTPPAGCRPAHLATGAACDPRQGSPAR